MASTTDTTAAEIGIIREDFSVIMAQAFATYGLSVVTDRALPDARRGEQARRRQLLRAAALQRENPPSGAASLLARLMC